MCKYQYKNDMREHDMPVVRCSLWVVGAVLTAPPRQKIDLYCDVIKTSWIMTGGHLRFPPVRNQVMMPLWKLRPATFAGVQTFGCTSHVACVSSLHMPNAIIGWDQMRLPTTTHTPLTGDAKTVAALNGMQIAPFQMMKR